ncbi:MAG TPA: hypothetical protein VF719_12350 [Abditibacteriaceae bacterium]|jgi:hypothetical protein
MKPFKPHDRVRIGGRTMLRPGYSLVGMSGTVFGTGEFAPPGHVQIIVDGEVVEDKDGARVLLVNVPSLHLEHIGPQSMADNAAPDEEPAIAPPTMLPPSNTQEHSPVDEPENLPEPPRGGLRLV